MRRLWRAVKLESAIDNPIDALRRIVHNLAGSAPMYGYDQLAERAATLDDCLRAAIEDGAKDATWHTGCEQAYLALYHELHVAMERDTP